MSNKQPTAVEQIKKHLELPHRETIISTNTLQTKHFDNQKLEIMSNKKPTAVEWLYNELFYFLNAKSKFEDSDQILDKAKEIEKEQIKKAWVDGNYNTDDNGIPSKNYAASDEGYYKKNYGGNK
jgi:hypothetical protein